MIAGVVYYMLLCCGGGGVFAGLVSLTTSPYSSELLVPGGGFVCIQGFAVCACARLCAFGCLRERERVFVKCRNG